jgi:hypothetical protein
VTPPPTEAAVLASQLRLSFDEENTDADAGAHAAARMFEVGMEADDPVVAYLVIYSAVALAASLHRGNSRQTDIDQWMRETDPSITTVEVIKRGVADTNKRGRPKEETIYTSVRNRFVHAEDRDADPHQARIEMAKHLPRFRLLAARMLEGQ